jgi:predicted dinucleotide-binding enzyme
VGQDEAGRAGSDRVDVSSGNWVPAWETVRKWMQTGSLAVTLPTSDAPVVAAFHHLQEVTLPTKQHRMARARVPLGRGPEADVAAACGAPAIPVGPVVGWGLGGGEVPVALVGTVTPTPLPDA